MRGTLHHLKQLASPKSNEGRNHGYPMRLLQRASSVSTSLDEEAERSFAFQEEEEQWKDESWNQNISEGAATLAALNTSWIFVRFGQLVRDLMGFGHRRPEVCHGTTPCLLRCRQDILGEVVKRMLPWRVLEFLFLLGLLKPLSDIKREPRAVPYFCVLSLYFIYVVMIGLPPLDFACQELQDVINCRQTDSQELQQQAANFDCSFQGETLVQVMMAWIMLTPRVVPTMKLMRATWFWIGAFYFGSACLQRAYYPILDKDGKEPHDIWDLLGITMLLFSVNLFAVGRKYYIEKGQRTKFIYDGRQREATQRIFRILEVMVPVHVIVPMLRGSVIAEKVDRASILFVMFVDFDQTARKKEPEALLAYLNHYFTKFDDICSAHEVTKIETVGEEYVSAVGVIPRDIEADKALGHAVILGRLIKAAKEILMVKRDTQGSEEEVKLKMGIHTGPVVAGVIGQKLPRFRLFGDTINTAARLMQKGLPGELQFGEATKSCLPKGVAYRWRDNIEMKGKGKVPTWLLGSSEASPASGPRPSPAPPSPPPKPKKVAETRRRVSFAEDCRSSVSSSERPSLTRLCSDTAEATKTTENSDSDSASAHLAKKLSLRSRENGESRRKRPTSRPASDQEAIELAAVSGSPSGTSRPSILRRSSRSSTADDGSASSHSLLGSQVTRSYSSVSSRPSTGRLSEVWNNEQTFEDVLRQVTAVEDPEEGRPSAGANRRLCGSAWMARILRCWRPEVLPGEQEKDFQQWFHEFSICKKMDVRLDRQALFMSVLTTADMFYTVFQTEAFKTIIGPMPPYELYSPRLRLPIFLCSRLAILCIILAWRVAFTSKSAVLQLKAQTRLLISYCAIAVLMMLSYDALTLHAGSLPQQRQQYTSSTRSIYSLLIMPMFQLIITQNPFLFKSSLVFVAVACVLMFLESTNRLFGNLFMTQQSRVVFIGATVVNAYVAHSAEVSMRQRFKAKRAVEVTHERTESILNTLMPVMVVEDLRDAGFNQAFPSHHYRKATIAQSDLCGFTKLASTRNPEEVVSFIGELFGLFDNLTDKYEVYKVETVGDAYIAGQAEVPLTFKNSPMNVVRFGLDMVLETHKWSRRMNEQVSCRVGVHSGECIGGIVGTEMQRYHLFGKLMTEVEVLESTAPEGRVQVSQACKDAVKRQMLLEGTSESLEMFVFEAREEPSLLTSKGEEHHYAEVGGQTYVVRSYATFQH